MANTSSHPTNNEPAPALTGMDLNLGDVGAAAPVREGAGLCLDDTADQISSLRGGDGTEAERVGSC